MHSLPPMLLVTHFNYIVTSVLFRLKEDIVLKLLSEMSSQCFLHASVIVLLMLQILY